MSQAEPPAERETVTCYLHPKREATLRCTRCERPICTQDAIEAPVGYQCPRCAEGGAPVRRMADLATAPITRGLVVVIGALFLLTQFLPDAIDFFGLRPVLVAAGGPELFATIAPWYAMSGLAGVIGEPWLLITSAFLHANLMHVGFNGLLLWQLGHLLEPTLGRTRYVTLYAAGLVGGALGVMVLSWVATLVGIGGNQVVLRVLGGNPLGVTIGASGAVFGLMCAAMVGLRQRGINPWKTSIGSLVALNLVITFVVPGISVGGHLGGLVGGFIAGRMLFVDREHAVRGTRQAALLTAGMLIACIVVANLTVGALRS